jgi:8-oxo-dGTP pyrophosphatase MutT (NUDIX family)
MDIDPRLVEIKDCIYRVAVKAIITNDHKILLVLDGRDEDYSFPGGGVDYGENLKQAVIRELHEEIGMPEDLIDSDFKIVGANIGHVAGDIPRTNLFFKVDVDINKVTKSSEISGYKWFTFDELAELKLDGSTGDTSEIFKTIQDYLS